MALFGALGAPSGLRCDRLSASSKLEPWRYQRILLVSRVGVSGINSPFDAQHCAREIKPPLPEGAGGRTFSRIPAPAHAGPEDGYLPGPARWN